MISVLTSSIEQGLIFAILAMGVFITFKVLRLSDLSIEGSFPFGAFLLAKFLISGVNPILAIVMALVLGGFVGLLTSMIFIKLKITPLLSSILTLTIMYSVNLRINGKSNVPLFGVTTLLGNSLLNNILILLLVVIVIKLALDLFFKTEVGYLLIATGDNEALVKSLGESVNKYKVIGLMISNALVAVSGAFMAQSIKVADINMGTSIIVSALASIIIGDTIMRQSKVLKGTTRAVIGAVVYKIIGGIAIYMGLEPTDMKAVNAIIIIVFIAYNNINMENIFDKEATC